MCAGSSLEDSVVRWCCISHAEQKKCEQWALSIKSDPLVCVRAVSMRDCVEKIKVSHINCRAYHTFFITLWRAQNPVTCILLPISTSLLRFSTEGRGGCSLSRCNSLFHCREVWSRPCSYRILWYDSSHIYRGLFLMNI